MSLRSVLPCNDSTGIFVRSIVGVSSVIRLQSSTQINRTNSHTKLTKSLFMNWVSTTRMEYVKAVLSQRLVPMAIIKLIELFQPQIVFIYITPEYEMFVVISRDYSVQVFGYSHIVNGKSEAFRYRWYFGLLRSYFQGMPFFLSIFSIGCLYMTNRKCYYFVWHRTLLMPYPY